MKTLIKNAILVNEGKQQKGAVLLEDEFIRKIYTEQEECSEQPDQVIDANGMYLLPGVIDDHVHFREPGLTHKADMQTESQAAAAGGVTSFMDMPNVNPLTTSIERLEEKFELAAQKSCINYSFFFGATNSNASELPSLDKKKVCGIKLFMGSSTGNMLVDQKEALYEIFRKAPMLIMTHCEDSATISANLARCKELYGDDPDVIYHPVIRSEEACYASTQLAVSLAQETGARLHIAHISTARELELLQNTPLRKEGATHTDKKITAEACVAHLLYSDEDYKTLGTRIKCNPAIKTQKDRAALRAGLSNGKIDVVGTDHAPHLLSEKKGGCSKAVSGMPMLQFSLNCMLDLADQGVLSLERVVELMAHAPASLFDIEKRGFIREGYYADLVLVSPNTPWEVTTDKIISKCGWSPLEGKVFQWKVQKTFCNGHLVYNEGVVDTACRGKALTFDR